MAPKKFQTDRFHFGEKSSPEIWGIFPEFGLPRLFLLSPESHFSRLELSGDKQEQKSIYF